eukprot:gb/GECG01004194.1/.p1 GENE.gb/GECG01004194.1/~~gb/GECG01004194.1/.p1  ORF type:complete len:650 (+),score=66.18 gb/GECG01004194.1/:1-1950(+)
MWTNAGERCQIYRQTGWNMQEEVDYTSSSPELWHTGFLKVYSKTQWELRTPGKRQTPTETIPCCPTSWTCCTYDGRMPLNPAFEGISFMRIVWRVLTASFLIAQIVSAKRSNGTCGKELGYNSNTHTHINAKRPSCYGRIPSKRSLWFTAVVVLLASVPLLPAWAADLRGSIMDGNEPCFYFIPEHSVFRLNCSTLEWRLHGYENSTHITLDVTEIFEGGGNTIDLTDINNFEGLFAISENVASFDKAPVIRNVHMRNGRTAEQGGFIVRSHQGYFIVDSCSSSGIINSHGGGICGYRCGRDDGDEIQITQSYSTGVIEGNWAGGITGRGVGYNGGTVRIAWCFSTGNIEGEWAGGICGDSAADTKGQLSITHSYSTGNMVGSYSGGIVGGRAGLKSGLVSIRECYTTGQIVADFSGGIAGGRTAGRGEVYVADCYSTGDIRGMHSGGIAGGMTGVTGNLRITNVYASGSINSAAYAAGIVGSVISEVSKDGGIQIEYSVYNANDSGDKAAMVGNAGQIINTVNSTGTSGDINDIRGKLYELAGMGVWDASIWTLNGSAALPLLCFQLPFACPTTISKGTPSPLASASMSPSLSPVNTPLSIPSPIVGDSSPLPDPPHPSKASHRTVSLRSGRHIVKLPLTQVLCDGTK